MTSPFSKRSAGIAREEDTFKMNVDSDPTLVTRHRQLLNSNEPPGDAESAYIRAVTAKIHARLTRLYDEISYFHPRLKELEEERDSLREYRAQNTAVLSAMRRMPPEILGEIFSWALPSVDEALDRRWFAAQGSPWALTHVSSRWRVIAISIPSLWSLVVINYTNESVYPSAITIIRTQLERARTLRIHFYGSERYDLCPQVALFKLLSEHSERWEELSVGLTAILVPHLAALRGRLPVLRRVWIQWAGVESQRGVQCIECFDNAPALVDVGANNAFQSVSILFPAHQLTCYRVDAPWEMHRVLLRMAPNLVEVKLDEDFEDADWPDPGEPIAMLNLRRLFVSDLQILDYIKAPGLEELALWIDEDDGPYGVLRHFEPFCTRSSCALRRVCIQGSPDTDSTAQILQKHPSVTEIAIVLVPPGDDEEEEIQLTFRGIFSTHLISVTHYSAALFQHLSEISFGCQSISSFEYSLYLDMLESRWKADDYALRKTRLLIGSGPDPNPATRRRLDALKEAGLDISLVSGPKAQDGMHGWVYATPWN
ncbi:hypothetical protein B0H11DRAFT_832861 [Mycena galericulata]|nr:hypothetical protein B0H11DRAFT_832861 [Mycena galericulata]